ncbi:glycoside hydrolase family 26 protein [Thalassotalea sp. PLHSN55]|uniref:glycoside hydrolase family 26 protein n=1 Tax=Thalassotalea sp. PLHSN55 TaxID=3435888 RepID=UPI003F83F4DC
MRLISNLTMLSLAATLIACNGSSSNTNQLTEQPSSTKKIIKGKFTPDGDKTLLFIGQDSDTISAYINEVPEDSIEGVTLYTQLKSNDINKTLFAVLSPADWQSGEMNFPKTLAESPRASLAVGLALDNCKQENHESNIANGAYDDTLNFMVEHFKSLAPRKVFLRIGYEFDGPWNCYTPATYKKAFRKIALAIKAQHADNIVTVWQSATWPDGYGNAIYDFNQTNHLENWYPGDDVVDWVAMSIFYRDLSQWNYVPPTTPAQSQEKVLNFAIKHNKPVMVAESAPQGYRTGALTHSFIQVNQQTPVTAKEIWENWYQPYFGFINENKNVIRAVAYINTHWETQAMWECQPGIPAGQEGCNGGNWGDSRIQANEYIKNKWLEQVNNTERWLQSSDY